jgi:hypothetical protein
MYQIVPDEVLSRQCPCLKAFDLGSALRTWRTRRRSDESRRTRDFTQVRPLGRVKTYVLLVWLCIDGVALMEELQWWRRLDLAEPESSKYRALRREVGGKVSSPYYVLPPNLLYAKVGSRDCSPSWLQIGLIRINPKRVLFRLSLRLRVFILYAKLRPWAAPGRHLHGLCDSFDSILPGPKSQVGECRGPICHSFVSSPRVPGIVEDYGRDSNSSLLLIARDHFCPSWKSIAA